MDSGSRRASVEKHFARHVEGTIKEARNVGYSATVFRRMIGDRGHLGAAKHLLAPTDKVSSGLAELWARQRLDLTVEHTACLPWFTELFTVEEAEEARKRLVSYGYPLERIDGVAPPQWYENPVVGLRPDDGPGADGMSGAQTGGPARKPSYRQRVEALEARQEAADAGGDGQGRATTTVEASRSAGARRLVVERSRGRCENPQCVSPGFHALGRDGQPILEVDHVHGLADKGPDHPVNMIAICPNCHAVKTRGLVEEAGRLRELFAAVARRRHEEAMSEPG